MRIKNVISEVIKNNMCAGCGICAGVVPEKIKIKLNNEGYLRPEITEKITQEENLLIEKICPGNVINYKEVPLDQPIWGNIHTSAIAFANDEEVRHKASSGGVLSNLLIFLLEKEEVDEVIHIGVSKENPLLNEIKRSRSKEDILRHSGSRYSPSAPLSILKEILDENKRFAFVGKPCDVAALRSYSKIDNRVSDKIPYSFSFFCAGVPSLEGTYRILEKFNVEKQNVKSFKYRGDGWPGLTKIVTKQDDVFQMEYDDSWGKVLNRHLQSRCKVCIDGIGEFADISCGDGWFGDESGYPKFEESKGRSLVTARTKRGNELFERAVSEGYIVVDKDISHEEIELIQPYQADRRKLLLSRIIAMKLFGKKTPKYPLSLLIRNSLNIGIKKQIRSFSGTALRIVKGKL
jgi:coenzyme F420 hydrogenase subunit beta